MLFSKNVESDEFEAVAMPHLKDLYRTAAYLVQDRAEAQDLVQNAYLLAWKSFNRFEPGTNCRAWLFKILFNEIHHYRRKWFKKRFVSEGEVAFQETLPFEPPIPEQIRDEEVLHALGQIPAEFREVVLLADVHEFTYKEIAETLNIAVGTVMSRLSRGRKHLRSKLAAYAKGYGIDEKQETVQEL